MLRADCQAPSDRWEKVFFFFAPSSFIIMASLLVGKRAGENKEHTLKLHTHNADGALLHERDISIAGEWLVQQHGMGKRATR